MVGRGDRPSGHHGQRARCQLGRAGADIRVRLCEISPASPEAFLSGSGELFLDGICLL